jgi:hypothetical protein
MMRQYPPYIKQNQPYRTLITIQNIGKTYMHSTKKKGSTHSTALKYPSHTPHINTNRTHYYALQIHQSPTHCTQKGNYTSEFKIKS